MAFSSSRIAQPGSSRRGRVAAGAGLNRKLKLEPAVDYDNDFGDGNLDIGDVGIDKLVRVELEARRRAAIASGSIRTLPVPSPPSTRRSTTRTSSRSPWSARSPTAGWRPRTCPPRRAPGPKRRSRGGVVPSEHAAQPHATPAPTPLAERTFARYPPGCGPFFGGRRGRRKRRRPRQPALRSAGFTANFCVIVATGALAPCASALIPPSST